MVARIKRSPTGRLEVPGPNMQVIVPRTEEFSKIREAFLAWPSGCTTQREADVAEGRPLTPEMTEDPRKAGIPLFLQRQNRRKQP